MATASGSTDKEIRLKSLANLTASHNIFVSSTIKYHTLGGFNNRHRLTALEAQMSKALVDLESAENLLLGPWMAILSL